MVKNKQEIPIQAVEKPIICSPYDEPSDHWVYDKDTGQASHGGERRPAGYWYKTQKTGSAQRSLFAEEERDDLPLVNRLRDDVRRWRDSNYRGASVVTRDLLNQWQKTDLPRRLFFCQREAIETLIYLAELRTTGKSSRTGFRNFEVGDKDLALMLKGEKPSFHLVAADYFPTLIDVPASDSLLPLRRVGCKMATGTGKTVVMAMLISWAFCNRGKNPNSKEFPDAVLVCCPNLTVKERLHVLRPDARDNYYDEFDLVPTRYRDLLKKGKVLIENWHRFIPESEHKEGEQSYAVVDKGPETPETLARRVLGDEMFNRMPIMVLNDEGHHCWRPAPEDEAEVSGEEKKQLDEEKQEATVWVTGLDHLNNAFGDGRRGVSLCVDMSATPFYIKGSGHPEGRPFPWLVSDFGLVDAIESGLVKIPRMPVMDTTGRPDPKYFRLWEAIRDGLEPAELQPGGRPKPEVIYREAEGALQQIAGQWVERFGYIQQSKPGQEHVPPVLIVVCDNTDLAEEVYRSLSGEREEEVVDAEDVEQVKAEAGGGALPKRKKKATKRTVYGRGKVYPEFFSNTEREKRTVRIDTKLLSEAESGQAGKSKQDAAEELRRVVSTVGKRGEPGEFVRCVVSVSMLTEGWDASNVTQILGLRAFGSQLLCEQVVGRGLRRMDYEPNPDTGRLEEEYVDVYGIPFSVIPFKGRPLKKPEPDDKPRNHVRALPERSGYEIRFPVVEGYVFDLHKNLIVCDVDELEPLVVEPNREPTATFVMPTVGYQEGHPSQHGGPFRFVEQNRNAYYQQTHLQTIKFEITRGIVDQFTGNGARASTAKERVLRLTSRHQLFPQVYRFVEEYVDHKVDFRNEHPCELGLEKYVKRIVERLCAGIQPDEEQGEPPLLPVLHRYKPIGLTADVSFKTTKPTFITERSHLNQVVADTGRWEQSAAFRIEQSKALFYVKNDHLGLFIPYAYMGIDHAYEPDFLVRLTGDLTVLMEIKGYIDDEVRAKHNAAKRWVAAVNNWGRLGRWRFHCCKDPQLLTKELDHLSAATAQ